MSAMTSPVVSWLQAFQLLPILALNTMLQPAGRVLGISTYNGVWLRASPFICVLDAVALIFRLLAYCALLHRTPIKVIVMIRKDRFDEHDVDHISSKTTVIGRVLGFLVGVMSLAYVWNVQSGIKWTMAWAWMYVAPYVVLEVVSQFTKHTPSEKRVAATDIELQTVAAAADFELEVGDGEEEGEEDRDYDDDDDEIPLINSARKITDEGTAPTSMHSPLRVVENNMDETKDDDYSTRGLDQASGSTIMVREDDIDSTTSLVQEEATDFANRTGSADPEAARDIGDQSDDILTYIRLPRLKERAGKCDVILLRVGCTLHIMFTYWAFLDLIHPQLGPSIRSTSYWSFPIHIVALPLEYVVMFAILFLSLAVMFLLYLVGFGFVIMVKSLWLSFSPTLIRDWPKKAAWAIAAVMGRYSIVQKAVIVVIFLPCFFAFFLVWSSVSIFFALFLWSRFMIWLYELVSAEVVVLIVFCLLCLGLRFLLEWVVEKDVVFSTRIEISRYLDGMGITLLTGVLVSFTLLVLWYRFRYPTFEDGHWIDNWRKDMNFNTTNTTNTN